MPQLSPNSAIMVALATLTRNVAYDFCNLFRLLLTEILELRVYRYVMVGVGSRWSSLKVAA